MYNKSIEQISKEIQDRIRLNKYLAFYEERVPKSLAKSIEKHFVKNKNLEVILENCASCKGYTVIIKNLKGVSR